MALEFSFVFPLKNGMHARPASRFQDVANGYRARITFLNHHTGATANGKSTLSLVATITREGDPCALVIDGEDEAAALEGMQRFVTEVFPGCDEDLPVPEAVQGAPRGLPRALRGEQLRLERGMPVSKGIGRAPAVLLSRRTIEPPANGWPVGTGDEEARRVAAAIHDIQRRLRAQVSTTSAGVERDILNAHLSIAGDPDYAAKVHDVLRTQHCSAGEALLVTADRYAEMLTQAGSAYLQERVIDIQDVTAQLVDALYGTAAADSQVQITSDAICIAETLAPSQFIALDKQHLKGLILAHGGTTSHTVILARSFGIPCVTGMPTIHRSITAGEDVILDADRGLVIRTPSEEVGRFYERETRTQERMKAKLRRYATLSGESADGRKLEIAANAASPEEVEAGISRGAEGIGLFRTEMLFMDRTEPPGEEEQYEIYARAVRSAGDRAVIIRTLDCGGDKPIPYLHLPQEENPFLGYRAVRLYAEYPAIINAQLRAILRASTAGTVKIMFPMICCVHEVRALKERLAALMQELDAEGIPYDHHIPVGIMAEIPSVAFAIDQLAREVDFFSIGSNDLTQYFLAVDRANTKISHLYTPFHPSFLRLLKQIIDEAHRWKTWVGLCGEMGGSPLAAPLFLAYGIDEVSMASSLIPAVKEVVHRCRVPACEQLLASVLQMESPEEVERALKEFASAQKGGALINDELVQLSSHSHSKEEAIRELVDLLHIDGRVDDADQVEDAVWAREETYPTGMGFGVAIPHCKSPHVTVNSIAVLKLERPITWSTADPDAVHFMILIAISAAAKGDQHLKIIAGLARKLMHEEFRQQLMEATNPHAVVQLLEAHIAS